MRRKSYAEMDCSVAQTLDIVGDPWTLLIVRDALRGVRRFQAFQDRLGIPRNTLTDRLQRLVDNDILARVPYQERPVRHEYVPTKKGRALDGVIISLMRWGDEWGGADEAPVVLIDRDSNSIVDPHLVDRNSGRPLSEIRVRAVDRADLR